MLHAVMDEQTVGHETMIDEEQLLSGERMRRRNLTLDWEGVDAESLRRLKQLRANAKRELTKAVKQVSQALTVGGDAGEIQAIEERLDESFHNFTEAWERHKNSLDDDDDLEESTAYFHEAKTRFLCSKDRIALWLETKKKPFLERGNAPAIEPKDSISSVGQSKSSFSCRKLLFLPS